MQPLASSHRQAYFFLQWSVTHSYRVGTWIWPTSYQLGSTTAPQTGNRHLGQKRGQGGWVQQSSPFLSKQCSPLATACSRHCTSHMTQLCAALTHGLHHSSGFDACINNKQYTSHCSIENHPPWHSTQGSNCLWDGTWQQINCTSAVHVSF